jgi:hypothetical protein
MLAAVVKVVKTKKAERPDLRELIWAKQAQNCECPGPGYEKSSSGRTIQPTR